MPTPRERDQGVRKEVLARLKHDREIMRKQLGLPQYGVQRAKPEEVLDLYKEKRTKYGPLWEKELLYVDGGQELDDEYQKAKEWLAAKAAAAGWSY